jgi:NAD(P)-dependent dehydrogenase (short-subunit alcohol dehydrogenase family)
MTLSIDLSGKRALITGVSSGIGLGIAGVMAEAGCDIAGCGLHDEDSDGAQAFKQSVATHQRQGSYQSLDLRDHNALKTWVAQSAEQLGGVDIVISNAGVSSFFGAANATYEQWNDALNINLATHWQLAKATRPYLLESSNPVIVVIASNHAWYTIPGCFPYNVAKAGLVAMVQSLAIEWGPDIRAVGIAPGFIDTPGGDTWFNSFPDPAAERARTEAMHPAGKIGTPTEIGGLCAFLSSPYAKFITGTTLLADGGRSALMQDS